MPVTIHSAIFDKGVAVPIALEFTATHHGLPNISFVGSARMSLHESKERVLSAFRSNDILLPRAKVTINLLPVDIPKQGSSLDLALALGLLMLHGILPYRENIAAIGELGLSGEVRHQRDFLPLIESLPDTVRKIVVSGQNIRELLLTGRREKVYVCSSLADVIDDMQGTPQLESLLQYEHLGGWWEAGFRQKELEGKIESLLAKVLEVSLVGGHHLLLYGSPGIGKSFVKSYLSGLLPPLSKQEMRERMLYRLRPYERVYSPHTSATIAGLLGGGVPFQAGALAEADGGVLFLDELPEFQSTVLESLRQPLEEEGITLVRSGRSYFVPCTGTVIATANPCPCGYFGEKRCRCSFAKVQQYMQRLSGPLLDRFALQYRMRSEDSDVVPLAQVAERISLAREFALERGSDFPVRTRLYTQEHMKRLGLWSVPQMEILTQRRKLQLAQVARTCADIRLDEVVREQDWDQARTLLITGSWLT